jgi:hypothetical protein
LEFATPKRGTISQYLWFSELLFAVKPVRQSSVFGPKLLAAFSKVENLPLPVFKMYQLMPNMVF